MLSLVGFFFFFFDQVTISIFDKGANPDQVAVTFTSQAVHFAPRRRASPQLDLLIAYTHAYFPASLRQLNYQNGEKRITLDPLTSEIDPTASNYTVGRVKVEVRSSCYLARALLPHAYYGSYIGATCQEDSRTMGQVSEG